MNTSKQNIANWDWIWDWIEIFVMIVFIYIAQDLLNNELIKFYQIGGKICQFYRKKPIYCVLYFYIYDIFIFLLFKIFKIYVNTTKLL